MCPGCSGESDTQGHWCGAAVVDLMHHAVCSAVVQWCCGESDAGCCGAVVDLTMVQWGSGDMMQIAQTSVGRMPALP